MPAFLTCAWLKISLQSGETRWRTGRRKKKSSPHWWKRVEEETIFQWVYSFTGPREENDTYPSYLPKLFHTSPYLKSSLITNHLRVFKRLSSYGAVTPFCRTGLGPEVKSTFLNLRMRKLSPRERTGPEWISHGAQGSRGPLEQAEANPAAQEFWSIPQSFTNAMPHVRLWGCKENR